MIFATSIKNALTSASLLLVDSASPRLDAEVLLCHVLGCNSAYLATWPGKQLSEDDAFRFAELIEQRASGTPVAYITGKREFWSLDLEVTPATLIPRPETESLVEYVLENTGSTTSINLVDLGTGSGAIAIAIASERPDWNIIATDVSDDALNIARQNADRHDITNIEFIHSHWFEKLGDKHFDIIISNPPYVAENDTHLASGDVHFEPEAALASGPEGMDDIKIIASLAPQFLKKNGWLVLEHGFDQKKAVFDCLQSAGFSTIHQKNDLLNQPRMTAGKFTGN